VDNFGVRRASVSSAYHLLVATIIFCCLLIKMKLYRLRKRNIAFPEQNAAIPCGISKSNAQLFAQ
jgi:hypothetical protein